MQAMLADRELQRPKSAAFPDCMYACVKKSKEMPRVGALRRPGSAAAFSNLPSVEPFASGGLAVSKSSSRLGSKQRADMAAPPLTRAASAVGQIRKHHARPDSQGSLLGSLPSMPARPGTQGTQASHLTQQSMSSRGTFPDPTSWPWWGPSDAKDRPSNSALSQAICDQSPPTTAFLPWRRTPNGETSHIAQRRHYHPSRWGRFQDMFENKGGVRWTGRMPGGAVSNGGRGNYFGMVSWPESKLGSASGGTNL
mmetsp:Transcript_136699/g.255325  ORF Transcript_136699/g.255325 Transcript_136699/m.255325 type:complete len:253 (-) Transcript_136699:310-1068(-)